MDPGLGFKKKNEIKRKAFFPPSLRSEKLWGKKNGFQSKQDTQKGRILTVGTISPAGALNNAFQSDPKVNCAQLSKEELI